jgi:hypothetical protein
MRVSSAFLLAITFVYPAVHVSAQDSSSPLGADLVQPSGPAICGGPLPTAADGFNYDVPNTPSFGNYLSTSRSTFITGLFTPSQFPVPAPGREGSLGRNTFDGPGFANVNLNVVKTAHIPWVIGGEGATLEFRTEIFNLFNRVNLNQPTSDLSSGLFGRSTSQRQPRQVQFGLRIAF